MPVPRTLLSPSDASLASFCNLVTMLCGTDETDAEFDAAEVPFRLSLLQPDAGGRPNGIFQLPGAFPPEGPPDALPPETAAAIKARFAEFATLRAQLAAAAENGEVPEPVRAKCGVKAFDVLRRLSLDLMTGAVDSGEAFTVLLRTQAACENLPAELVSVRQTFEDLWREDGMGGRIGVSAAHLVWRLPFDGRTTPRTPRRIEEWSGLAEAIEARFAAAYRGAAAVVELRDAGAVTLLRRPVSGMTYAEAIAERERLRAGHSAAVDDAKEHGEEPRGV